MAAPDGQLRASDAERERIIEVLRRHTADGRLTLEEFEQRVGEALAATTRADLGPVLRELPPLGADAPVEAGTAARRTRWPSLDGGRAVLGAVVIVAVATVIATGAWGMWWIVFPLMAVFGGCGRGAASCSGARSRHARDRRPHRGHEPDVDREVIRV